MAEDFSKSELASYLSLPLAEAARQASMSCAAQIMESSEPSYQGVLQDGGTATNGMNVCPSQQNVRSSLAIQVYSFYLFMLFNAYYTHLWLNFLFYDFAIA